jgi:ATP-dependent exoDNAse (exonuclease V) alpha subunit
MNIVPLLNNEQLKVFNKVIEGNNIFLTGEAGSGKSFVIEAIKEWAKFNNKKMVITAPTGIAAQLAGGITIHSFINSYVDKEDQLSDLVNYSDPEANASMNEYISSHEIIVVDEISMLNRNMLQIFNKRIKESYRYQNRTSPTILFVGDFKQLAPICKQHKRLEKFVMSDPLWNELDFSDNRFLLEENHRQKGDTKFIKILNNIRNGEFSDGDLIELNSRYTTRVEMGDEIYLCKTNKAVDFFNIEGLKKTQGKMLNFDIIYDSKNVNNNIQKGIQSFIKETAFEYSLELKVNSRVMTLINTDNYKNGTLGTILGLRTDKEGQEFLLIKNQQDNSELSVYRANIPYNYYNESGQRCSILLKQFPVRLAYAITIHKSQGQTFDYARIIMSQPTDEGWEKVGFNDHGLMYTALSRVRSLNGLSINHPLVREDFIFYF